MTDPLTLVFMALSAVTSGLLFLFRQLMVEKDRSFTRLENDCAKSLQDVKEDNQWLKGQLEDAQRNQLGTLNVMSEAVKTQGIGVKTMEVGIQAILGLLQTTVEPRNPRAER